jgi:hypothetical protein
MMVGSSRGSSTSAIAVAWLVDVGDRGGLAEQIDDDGAMLDTLDASGDLLAHRERMLPRCPARK